MFNFFKKNKSFPTTDKVWISHEEKLSGLVKAIKIAISTNRKAIIFYYFPATKRWLETCFEQEKLIFSALDQAENTTQIILVPAFDLAKSGRVVDTLNRITSRKDEFIFANHHPKLSKETEVLTAFSTVHGGGIEVCFYLSFDDELMKFFNAERIKEMMIRMGYKEGEVIQHSMITKSIKNAQKKIDAKALEELRVDSQEEWFRVHLPR